MSGLFALLDDVAALVRLSAASLDDIAGAAGRAGAKAAGVVVDDTAVTPRYVQGLDPKRELTIIRRIATGSLRNKILFILPAALLLSQFLPWSVTPILMLGALYLCYEGAEKVWEKVSGHAPAAEDTNEAAAADPEGHEREVVAAAVRTDFILSAEIMVIALNEVASQGFVPRLIILLVVAVAITMLVYGAVAVIVKMDDAGLVLAKRGGLIGALGRGLVKGMPVVLAVLATVGVAAMLWVGGHILLVGVDELGVAAPYALVRHLEEVVLAATGPLGGFLGWLTNTAASAVVGLVLGAIVVAVLHLIPRRKKDAAVH